MAKVCTVSRLERQFATLYLFHAPTPPPPPTCLLHTRIAAAQLNFYGSPNARVCLACFSGVLCAIQNGEWEISSQNSILFEIDGPYRCMVLPASTEEDCPWHKELSNGHRVGLLQEQER